MWSSLLLLSALPNLAAGKALESGRGGCATGDADERRLSACLRPWLDTWESVRENSAASARLLFPVFHFQREQVLALCDVYIEKLDTCLTDALAESCSDHFLLTFLRRHIGYICGPEAVEVLSQFDCLSAAMQAEPDCARLSHGVPVPGSPEDSCPPVLDYLECLQEPLKAACGAPSAAILGKAVRNFGCEPLASPAVAVLAHKEVVDEVREEVFKRPPKEEHLEEVLDLDDTSIEAALNATKEEGAEASQEALDKDSTDESFSESESLEEKTEEIVSVGAEEESKDEGEGEESELEKEEEDISEGSGEGAEEADEEELEPTLKAAVVDEAAPVIRETIEFPSDAALGIAEFPDTPLRLNEKEGEEIDSADFISDSLPTPAKSDDDAEDFLDSGIGFQLNLKRPAEKVDEKFLRKPEEVKILPSAQIPVDHSQPINPNKPIQPDAAAEDGATEASEDEMEGSGDDSTPGRILPASKDSSMEVSGSCSLSMEARIVACYAPLSAKWDEITERAPATRNLLFPLFAYPTTDLLSLCDVLQATLDDCLDDALLSACARHPLMHFVDGILGFACGRHKTDFFLSFDCIRDAETEASECGELIRGQPRSGLSPQQRCQGMPAYVGCLRPHLAQACTPETMRMFLSAIQHYGCPIQGEIIATAPGPPVEIFHKPTPKLSIDASKLSPEQLQRFGSPTPENPHRVGAPPFGVPPPPVENSHPIISSFCTPRIRQKVRRCLRPLFVDWLRYRASNPQLDNITFPILFYEQRQLLEMCDLYASAFLDCDFPLFDVCLTDEIVRFANNHLGYICSPSKIQGFMGAFECSKDTLEAASAQCLSFIRGPSEPGNDLQRCDGMSSFYDCVLHRIQESCGNASAGQLRNAIHQFGCDVDVPNSVVQFAKIKRLA